MSYSNLLHRIYVSTVANVIWLVLIQVIKQLSSIQKPIVLMSPMIVLVAHCACPFAQLSTASSNNIHPHVVNCYNFNISNLIFACFSFSMVPKTIPHIIKRGKPDKVFIHALLPSQ